MCLMHDLQSHYHRKENNPPYAFPASPPPTPPSPLASKFQDTVNTTPSASTSLAPPLPPIRGHFHGSVTPTSAEGEWPVDLLGDSLSPPTSPEMSTAPSAAASAEASKPAGGLVGLGVFVSGSSLGSSRSATPGMSSTRGMPILPPSNPLRSKLYTQTHGDAPSPPTVTQSSPPAGVPPSAEDLAKALFDKEEYHSTAKHNKTLSLDQALTPTHPPAYAEAYSPPAKSFSHSLSPITWSAVNKRYRTTTMAISLALFVLAALNIGRAWDAASNFALDTLYDIRGATHGGGLGTHLAGPPMGSGSAFTRKFSQSDKGISRWMKAEVEDAQRAERRVQEGWGVAVGESLGDRFLNKGEELAALIGFVTSTTSNALPDLDPTIPIDPSLILEFDPSTPNAPKDIDILQWEVNTLYPVVLFGRMRDPYHREIKKILASLNMAPAPLVIDVDQREDSHVFIPVLERLLGSSKLPQLLLQGEVVGDYHEVMDMVAAGKLKDKLVGSGAVTARDQKAKVKKRGLKERERQENERVLRPRPIADVA
ncbi:hypothetical protein IAT38_008407 [Cryptococcus sp. DSM 104549]